MNTKDLIRAEKLADLTHDLHKIRALVGLCGLASEAMRTLRAIELATEIKPSIGDALDGLIEARLEWHEHDAGNIGLVLKEIGYRLEGSIAISDELESGYE